MYRPDYTVTLADIMRERDALKGKPDQRALFLEITDFLSPLFYFPEGHVGDLFIKGQMITSNHFTDSEGNPSGGTTYGVGFTIGWQNGPLGRGEDRQPPNGAFVEDIIAAAINRIEFYQASKFACQRNQETLAHLRAALASQNGRTAAREARGVEGTHDL